MDDFVRQLPEGVIDDGPLDGDRLSRRQLRVDVTPDGATVCNLGKAMLLIDGVPVDPLVSWPITPGTVLIVRGHSVLFVVKRPLTLLPPGAQAHALHELGEADADGIVGEGPAAWAMRAGLEAAVLAAGNVLILGETGTGKELLAKAIHRRSGRRGQILAYSAANLPPGLVDSILFGNVANYPNPGMPESPGLVGRAEGSTLFLDELGELSLEAQAKLLRVLEGEGLRLGEAKARKVDVLVVGATNRDRSTFKLDLLMRFRCVLVTPPLSARLEDVTLLARAIVLKEAERNPRLAGPFVYRGPSGRLEVKMAPALVLALLRWSWDGNVRQLGNLLVNAMTENKTPPLMPPAEMSQWRLPPTVPPPPTRPPPKAEAEQEDPDVVEERRIREELARHDGRMEPTAKALGLNRHQLARRMTK